MVNSRNLCAVALACVLTAGCGGDDSATPVSAKELCFSPDSSAIGWTADLQYNKDEPSGQRFISVVRTPVAGDIGTLFPGVTGASDSDPSLRIRFTKSYSTSVILTGTANSFALERVEQGRVTTLAEHLSHRTYSRNTTYQPGRRDLRLELVDGASGSTATQQYWVGAGAGSNLMPPNVEQTNTFLGIQSIETPTGVLSACGFEITTSSLQVDTPPKVQEKFVEWIYRGVVVKTDWNTARPSDVLTSGQVNNVPIK